ncbi:MAG: HNH endonuclease [Deltaproteobacteria bacterium]|nr:HNH endonuclease [Deltaproteobacteria bacterium]
MRTLVLDMGYQPINAVPFTRALSYIIKGKVDLLATYQRSIHPDWLMPAVVRLTHFLCARQHVVKFSRQNVLARDRFRCQYCGERKPIGELTFDHVLPRSRGGRTEWRNIVIACLACNSRKANRTPEEAGMRLRCRPARPSWLPLFGLMAQPIDSVPAEWRDYWTVEISR